MSGIIEAVGRLDFATFQLLRLYHWPALDIVMASLSDIAAGAGIWVALTLLIGLIHRRRWPAALQVLLAIALTIVVTESVVKPLVNRRRPFESYADTRVYGFRSTTPSFPSGMPPTRLPRPTRLRAWPPKVEPFSGSSRCSSPPHAFISACTTPPTSSAARCWGWLWPGLSLAGRDGALQNWKIGRLQIERLGSMKHSDRITG